MIRHTRPCPSVPRRLALAAPVALLALLAACGGPRTGGNGQETTEIEGSTVNFHGVEGVVGQNTEEMELNDDYFESTVLRGKPGQQLTLQLTNEGSDTHTFTIRAQDVDEVVEAGQTAEAKVTFLDSGTQLFTCRFHGSGGMRGALTVESDVVSPGPPATSPEDGGGGGY